MYNLKPPPNPRAGVRRKKDIVKMKAQTQMMKI